MNILKNSNFSEVLLSSTALTQTGTEVLEKYKAYVLNNPINFSIINQFLNEAANHTYDTELQKSIELISAYIQDHSTSWTLASVCENILNNGASKYDILNRSAARKAMEILERCEGEEEDLVRSIKTGALKEVMYCEGIRNIVKQVLNNQVTQIVEKEKGYERVFPVSYTEAYTNPETGNSGMHFEVLGELYLVENDSAPKKGDWRNVSDTFKTVTKLFESNIVSLVGDNYDNIKVYYNESCYFNISETGELTKCSNEDNSIIQDFGTNVDAFRDHNRLVLMATPTIKQKNTADLLESIALVIENYDNVAILNNAAIIELDNNQGNFLVIESGDYLYAKSLNLPLNQKFELNSNALEVISFIKENIRVDLNKHYKRLVENNIEQLSQTEKLIKEEKENKNELDNIKVRIEQLTNQFKNDPAKLAILTKLASEISEI